MTDKSTKRGRLALLARGLVSLLPGMAAADETYVQYDFSKPQEVFAATLSQSIVDTGVDPAALYRLLKVGQLVMVRQDCPDPRIPWVTTNGIVVDAPPEAVWGVVRDFKSYQDFMPQTRASRSEPVTSEIEHVFIDLAVRVLLVSVDIKYSLYHYNQPPRRSDWVFASGEFLVNVGAYEVVPVPGDPSRSMLFYSSYSQPSAAVVRNLFESVPSLDTMVNLSAGTLVVSAMRDRAEALYRAANPGAPSPRREAVSMSDVVRQERRAVQTLSRKGTVLFIEDGQPRHFGGVAVVPRSQADTFALLREVEAFSANTELVDMKWVSREGETAVVDMALIFRLMVDFTSRWTADFTFEAPDRMAYVGRPGGDIEGVVASWETVELGPEETLVLYRNTSDLRSQGVVLRKILDTEPSFELGIQASQTMLMTRHSQTYLTTGK